MGAPPPGEASWPGSAPLCLGGHPSKAQGGSTHPLQLRRRHVLLPGPHEAFCAAYKLRRGLHCSSLGPLEATPYRCHGHPPQHGRLREGFGCLLRSALFSKGEWRRQLRGSNCGDGDVTAITSGSGAQGAEKGRNRVWDGGILGVAPGVGTPRNATEPSPCMACFVALKFFHLHS